MNEKRWMCCTGWVSGPQCPYCARIRSGEEQEETDPAGSVNVSGEALDEHLTSHLVRGLIVVTVIGILWALGMAYDVSRTSSPSHESRTMDAEPSPR